MPQVARRPLAEADILEVWDYIADDNPAAADRSVDQLHAQFLVLATQPVMGRARNELAPGVRSFPVGRYVVFYVPLDDGIDVVCGLHGVRDIDAVFQVQRAVMRGTHAVAFNVRKLALDDVRIPAALAGQAAKANGC